MSTPTHTDMRAKLVRSSVSKNWLVSAFMAVFLAVGAALLASAVILALGVAGAIDGFMETAKTPHFMQMHGGELDEQRLRAFVEGRDDVVAWEAIELVNVDNARLTLGGTPLDTELQQNGFVAQPEHLDHLLTPDGETARPRAGEVYVPLYYADTYDLSVGDTLDLATERGLYTLTIAGEFRDSQMNSTLASSKRLLVSQATRDELSALDVTTSEYLISFRLTDPTAVPAFEAAYFAAGLENDGPSLTWSLFRLINAINDGVTVLLLVLMAAVVVLISLLCVRYSLLTTVEEDLREIGIMKALGVRARTVASIYLAKYRLLLGAGAVTGLLAALVARGPLLANARDQLGAVGFPVLGVLAAAAGVAVLYAFTVAYVRRVLKRVERVPALHALYGRAGLNERLRRPKPVLTGGAGTNLNLKLAAASFARSRASHLTVLAVALLITLALLVPFRFAATARSPEFVTYMGIGQYDLRVDLLGHDDARTAATAITTALAGHPDVVTVQAYVLEVESVLSPTRGTAARATDGAPGTTDATRAEPATAPLRVDYGDHAAFPLRYGVGRGPETQHEIALSEINAERLGVGVGDTLSMLSPTGPIEFTVTGTYQDVTNGGKTAKALPGPTMDAERVDAMIAVRTVAGTDLDALTATIAATADGASVTSAGAYVRHVLGDLLGVLDTIAVVFAVVALVLSVLMAGMAVRLMLVQERKANAVQLALGLTGRDLRRQYWLRIMTMFALGAAVGLVLATPVGNAVGNAVFSTVGVSGLTLRFDPLATGLGAALVLAAAWAATHLLTPQRMGRDLVDRLRA